MTRIIRTLLATLIFATAFFTSASSQPKHEVRAVWLTTIGGIDWPHSYAQSVWSIEKQKDELRTILDRLEKAGINTVLLQTRIRGTVIYSSNIEPWDGCLSGHPGKSPGYDALRFAIDECHKRGMEAHAWIVTMPVGKWDALGCKRLRSKMPGNIIKIKADGYMNPESAQTANYLADICEEVTRGYDIDGIHLDYIRYPENLPKLKKLNPSVARDNITRIVRTISKRVKTLKPWVKMSCSPIGKYDNTSRYWSHGWDAYNTVYQDAVAWLRDGLMDELFPMMYFRDNNFFPFALDWKEQSHGRIVVPGLGIYFMSPKEKDWPLTDITRQLFFLRDIGMGHAYFRSKFFTDNTKGIYDFATDEYGTYPSLIPPMTWAKVASPQKPYDLTFTMQKDGAMRMTWQHQVKDTTMMLFNVYSSTSYPVDTKDARNLVAIRRQARSLLIPSEKGRHYAVTATDRYGNESIALQEAYTADTLAPQQSPDLLKCDGRILKVPDDVMLTDAQYLLVETMQGAAVATLPYKRPSTTVNITSIPNGIYHLRTLNRKGRSHRLGTFIVKRI